MPRAASDGLAVLTSSCRRRHPQCTEWRYLLDGLEVLIINARLTWREGTGSRAAANAARFQDDLPTDSSLHDKRPVGLGSTKREVIFP
jgi:hypothetical protein